MSSSSFDLALVGGGLQNGLIALAVLAARPGARVAIFERGAALGGNHTWCLHDSDVPAEAKAWCEPLVAHRWDGYDVHFAHYQRALDLPYACITAARLAEVVRARLAAAPGCELHTDTEVVAVGPGRVLLRDRTIRATTVVDARGPERTVGEGGWQKFVGLELVLAQAHGLTRPMLMDATVAQRDGFRFMYVLPLAPDRVLVEDTCFSDDAALDAHDMRVQALAYASGRGWVVRDVVREERGVLPQTWRGEVVVPVPGLITAGYQGGWFHPVTGYSFPVAIRVAAAIGGALGRGEDPAAAVAALVPAHRAQLAFAQRLVWMMFRWFTPERRAGVLEHFYRLPEDTVQRFYALAMTGGDKARLFLGRPPRGLSWRRLLSSGSRPPLAVEVRS